MNHSFGLIAAPFTPFAADGNLNLATVERQAEFLVRHNLRGVFVCGTTGEGASLTDDERVRLARRWCEVGRGKLEVIVHVGHTSAIAARTLAEEAQRDGAAGIGAIAPYFFKPRNVTELADFCAIVASGAPSIPFYYYHLPSLSGVNLSMAQFLPVAAERIPNFRGIKFTYEDLMDYGMCLEAAGDRYEIFFGRDEILLAALALGARSAVGSTYNFAAPIYQRMIQLFEQGDLAGARLAQSQARAMIAAALKFAPLPAMKRVMQWIGLDCGPCRLPLRDLDEAEAHRLRQELEQMGFFQWVETK